MGIKEQIKKRRNYWTVDNLDYKRQNQEGKQPKGRVPAAHRGRRDDAEMEKKNIRGHLTGH